MGEGGWGRGAGGGKGRDGGLGGGGRGEGVEILGEGVGGIGLGWQGAEGKVGEGDAAGHGRSLRLNFHKPLPQQFFFRCFFFVFETMSLQNTGSPRPPIPHIEEQPGLADAGGGQEESGADIQGDLPRRKSGGASHGLT